MVEDPRRAVRGERHRIRIEVAEQVADRVGGADQHVAPLQGEHVGTLTRNPLLCRRDRTGAAQVPHRPPRGQLLVLRLAHQPVALLEGGEHAVTVSEQVDVGPDGGDVGGHPAVAGGQPQVDRAPGDQLLVERQGAARLPLPLREVQRRMGVEQHRHAVAADPRAAGRERARSVLRPRQQRRRQELPVHQVAAARVPPPHAHLHRRDVVGPGQELEEDVVPAAVVERAVHVVHPLRRRQKVVGRACRIGSGPWRRLRHRRHCAPSQFVELRHGATNQVRRSSWSLASRSGIAYQPQTCPADGITCIRFHGLWRHGVAPRTTLSPLPRVGNLTHLSPTSPSLSSCKSMVCIYRPPAGALPCPLAARRRRGRHHRGHSRLGAAGGLVRACRCAPRELSGGRRLPWAGSSSAGRSPRRAVAAGSGCCGPAAPPASRRSPSASPSGRRNR